MADLQQQVDLNGSDWQLKGYIGEDWRWRDAHKPGTRDTSGWIAATVPGSVAHDLWQAELIPDPYYEQNTLLCEWVSARTWLYKKHFTVDEQFQGQQVQLCFEGIDYEASFYLNGEPLGHHRSMFTPVRFDVSDHLRYGEENLLAVVIEPAPHEQPQVGRTSLVRTHKSRMTYWWDFCPRLVHQGIWDGVHLEVTGPVRIENVFVRPQLNEDYSEATVAVRVTLSSAAEHMVTLQTDIDEADIHEETRYLVPRGSVVHEIALKLAHPRLWWPNGFGNQSLYEVKMSVKVDENMAISDRRLVPFGVREIEFIDNEHASPDARPYTLRVNGRKVYIKGWNWVPMDLLYGVERSKKRERLLNLAQRAHVNLLRIWGGGLIEKEAFYRLCDRLGILVWQEFIQSSSGIGNTPPSDNTFVNLMMNEAQKIVWRRRNHPSLAIWGGGNELQDTDGRPLDDTHPLLKALGAVVAANDPDRYWLPTSPTGPRFGNTIEDIEEDPQGLHDVHGPWIYQGLEDQYKLSNMGTSLLNSEFGTEGITNLRTLNRTVSKARQKPIRRDNPIWHHLGAWWIWEERWHHYFGDLSQLDVSTVVRATQCLQAEGLRYAVEANRRRKYQNSGSLPWQYNEPYPMAACTSAVDYYAQPKPVYYAVARAYAPLLLSARFPCIAWADEEVFEATIWTCYSGDEQLSELTLEAKLVTVKGEVCAQTQRNISVAPNAATELGPFQAPVSDVNNDIFFLDLALSGADDVLHARSRYPFSRGANLAPLLSVPPTELNTSKQATGNGDWRLTICNDGEHTALGVWLDVERDLDLPGYAYFDDNYFHLLPGEQKILTIIWDGIPEDERRLLLQACNVKEKVIS